MAFWLHSRSANSMDAISLLEAAYRMDDTADVWLEGVVRHATPFFESAGGEGVAGLVIDATQTTSTHPHLLAVRLQDLPGDATLFSDMLSLGIQPTTMLSIRRAGPVCTLSVALGEGFDDPGGCRDQLRKHALGDAGHVVAGDPLHLSCVLATSFPRKYRFSNEQSLLWQLLGAHISAGLRLRIQLPQLPAADDRHVEAVLDPDGTLHHAVAHARFEPQRARLRDAARSLIRAQGAARNSDPLKALFLWQALIAGRWSLVDRVESDGRRFLLACRNEPRARGRRALSHREAQVATLVGLGHANKVVAYELGIALSSVSTHLKRALRKLGVSSRTELVELFLRSVP